MSNETEVQQIVSGILDDIIVDVSQGKKKAKETVKIFVGSISWDGLWTFYVTQDTKISRLKMLSLYELHGNEFDAHVNYYMLTFPSEKRTMHETKTIKEERLKNDDELELIKLPPPEEIHIQFVHHISDSAIAQVTNHLPKPIERPNICNVVLDIQPPEFMSDVRKIMITLIEHSLQLMSTKPNAKYIFDVVRRKLMSENFFIDQVMTRSVDSESLGIPATFRTAESLSVAEELQGLLKLFRQYLRASFKLCNKAVENLTEMGFETTEIHRALRYTGNNTSESVEYLIGNVDPKNDGAKPGLDQGMSPTSDMFKEIMSQEDIITPLYNPSVLYACLSVMDANSFLISSIRFPSTMSLLNKILTTYYVSKCDMAMNQILGFTPND